MSRGNDAVDEICRRLGIRDPACVEIESKWRVGHDVAEDLGGHLAELPHARAQGRKVFCDQFLDTPDRRLLRAGASLRMRCKGGGSRVYLQYKGPGFRRDGILYRSELSSERVEGVVLEESRHDAVRFSAPRAGPLLRRWVTPAMADAMRLHLGYGILGRITEAPVLCVYHKIKFAVDVGASFLEPSLDRLLAFRVSRSGLHAVSAFWEYENEVKDPRNDIRAKIEKIPVLLRFDARIAARFGLRPCRLDKYHRCATWSPGRR